MSREYAASENCENRSLGSQSHLKSASTRPADDTADNFAPGVSPGLTGNWYGKILRLRGAADCQYLLCRVPRNALMKRTTQSWLRRLLFLLLVAGAYLGLRTYAERYPFDPSDWLDKTPRDLDLPFDSVVVTASDGVNVHGWLIPQDPGAGLSTTRSTPPTLLFLHGGDGNMSDRLEKIRFFHDLGLDVFIIDYRGYGKSGGSPSEQGLAEDALAAHAYLVNQRGVKPEQLYLYGEDLGAAVAIALATKADAAGLITEGASASVLEKLQQRWPLVPWRYLDRDPFDSLSKIGAVRMPVLFIHSADDEAVPCGDSKRLFALARDPRELAEIHGSHKDAFLNSFDAYYDAISRFVHSQPRSGFNRPGQHEPAAGSSSTPGAEPASKEPTP
jgi:fermentation-respiration switch protein FrsA (DUF1100 family)